MKKMIAVLIAALMLATTVFAGAALAADEDPTGVWYMQSMKQDGTEMDASILTSMGMSMTLTLNEDGTASMSMTGQEEIQEGTWSFDGTTGVLSFGNELTFTVEDDTIIMEQPSDSLEEGMEPAVVVFGREPAEAASVSLAPAVEDPELSDFNGTWNATTYVAFGLPLPLSMSGADITMTLDEGKAQVTAITKDLNNHSEVIDTKEEEFAAELTNDGTLYVDFEGVAILEALQLEGSGIYLTLHEDGRLSGEIPEVTESMKAMSEMSAESENQAAEGAESAEPAEGEGESEGEADSSGSSGGSALEAYLIFEKAE